MRVSYLPLMGLIVVLGLFASGCDTATGPVHSAIPLGYYRHEETLDETRRARVFELRSQETGYIRDTVWTQGSGGWKVDTAWSTELRFQLVGDGYFRTIERRSSGGILADSTVSYWYFFLRGDTLHYYNGVRLLGKSLGLTGKWESDPRDTLPTGSFLSFDFNADSVTMVERNVVTGDHESDTYAYDAEGDRLTIKVGNEELEARYEVVPGWSLYITNDTSAKYVRVR
jgi:hypothetical protein